MVQRIALELANGFAMLGARVEHQHRSGRRVTIEHGKHLSLGRVIEMKKAIPGEDAIEAASKCQLPHICDDPFLTRQAAAAKRDHRRR